MEKLSSMKPVPGAKKVGDRCFRGYMSSTPFCTFTIFILFLRDGIHVAVKIIKNVGRYREAARSEIQVLEHLNSTDPNSIL